MPSTEQLPAGAILMATEWESYAYNQVESDEAVVIQHSNQHIPSLSHNQYTCNNPINPHMKSLRNRINSFYSQSWNRNFLQASPEELADAGLFFTGKY